eukprot:gnl/Trimastix_PCT/1671.p1 GENE.gnl/Trimastix_PCT/1671~~gnl/Trimastix_PCT/1671.p1  ORF type:complete len:168 (+),score=23.90 gnl/Trimastix_PCT/1671:199-702(+)
MGCCLSTPPPSKEYIGQWAGSNGDSFISLWINKNGTIMYEKQSGFNRTRLQLGVRSWDKDAFRTTCCCCTCTFHISEAPHVKGDRMVMTLDGTELVRLVPPLERSLVVPQPVMQPTTYAPPQAVYGAPHQATMYAQDTGMMGHHGGQEKMSYAQDMYAQPQEKGGYL